MDKKFFEVQNIQNLELLLVKYMVKQNLTIRTKNQVLKQFKAQITADNIKFVYHYEISKIFKFCLLNSISVLVLKRKIELNQI